MEVFQWIYIENFMLFILFFCFFEICGGDVPVLARGGDSYSKTTYTYIKTIEGK